MSTQKRTFIPESDVTVEYGRDIKATMFDKENDEDYMIIGDRYVRVEWDDAEWVSDPDD